ncbi:MAG: hypothetical protein NDJ92_12385 [Thermoanaerobaculia bacterium]|nr:hypothetical protein [Thermoanaerobaculia bacterium]
MILAVALSAALIADCHIPVTHEDEGQLLQIALERLIERNQDLANQVVLVSCSTTEIAPTGGVPLQRDAIWADQEDRSRSQADVRLSLPSSWQKVDLSRLDSASTLDWRRIEREHPSTVAVVRFARPGFSMDGRRSLIQTEVLLPNGQRGWFVFWLERTTDGWSQVNHKSAWAPVGYSFPYDGRWEISQAPPVH